MERMNNHLLNESEETKFAKISKFNVTQNTKNFISNDFRFICTLIY